MTEQDQLIDNLIDQLRDVVAGRGDTLSVDERGDGVMSLGATNTDDDRVCLLCGVTIDNNIHSIERVGEQAMTGRLVIMFEMCENCTLVDAQ
ncbi:MAG: hypothetical protein JSV86_10360 [Gemmatimonadota bacterium]|nr:MAG: hypothetical protein JSV86_10360 [Gemmatimonadota bacterium]